jgi:hypothetical protein
VGLGTGRGKRGEMTQTLYAYMNKIKFKKPKKTPQTNNTNTVSKNKIKLLCAFTK